MTKAELIKSLSTAADHDEVRILIDTPVGASWCVASRVERVTDNQMPGWFVTGQVTHEDVESSYPGWID